jgi:uncharacterized membrane protein YedE/YeeE
MDLHSSAQWLTLTSFFVGLSFGFIAQRSQFCTMGAIADVLNFGDWSKAYMWLLAIAVSTLLLQSGIVFGELRIDQTHYLNPDWPWLSNLIGGAMFGCGMVMASGCGSKTLVRLGAGNLKSIVVLLTLSVFALMALKGITAVVRVQWFDSVFLHLEHTQSAAEQLAFHLNPTAALALRIGLPSLLLLWVLSRKEARTGNGLLGGIGIGLAVAAAWWLTLSLGFVAEDPDTLEARYLATYNNRPEALTFTAPLAHTLEWLSYFSDSSKHLTLGVASTFGLVVGAFLSAKASGQFRLESFRTPEDLSRHLWGAALMGTGGVLALGCSIGQGITGLATLSFGSMLAVTGMVLGAAWRIKTDLKSI